MNCLFQKGSISMQNKTIDFCTFCSQEKDKIYIKTENFTVWLAIGQIVEGYSLIMPNDHYHCIGALPDILKKEYLQLKQKVRNLLTKYYGACIFYEHGRVGYCNVQPGEQLCYHGHLHAVPVAIDLLESFKADGLFPIELEDDREFFKAYMEYGHYLYYEDVTSKKFLVPITQPLQRQYLRFLTAIKIVRPELANWQEYPEWNKFYSAKKKLMIGGNNE